MHQYIEVTGRVLPQTIYSEPVLHHTFLGNRDTIKSCLFNPGR